jgi:oxygen-independent coproporphyrinogen III oxidase
VAGVYISYPFCAQKCTFCNFASGVFSSEMRARYENALLAEVRAHSWEWLPETVYFGGGTPSQMRLELLRDLMHAVPREALKEVTLECAPGTVTREAADSWAASGINRVSLGVQSFVESELRQTGRRHTAEVVQRELAILRDAGLDNINIDLIAGLPGQTRDSWQASLQWIERLRAPHASVYIFEVDEDSRLGNEILLGGKRYGAANVPNDDLTAEFYEMAVERLARAGLMRYEISNFARAGFESRHNLKYWQLEPYVGFGLDAHSFDGHSRWSNPDTLDTYFAQPRPMRVSTDAAEEHFFVGLRLMRGIEPSTEEWSRFAEPIAKWREAGLLEHIGSRLRLSHRGVLVSNEIFQEFLVA